LSFGWVLSGLVDRSERHRRRHAVTGGVIVIGARRLLHAEVARTIWGISSNVIAHEVLNNIDAMVYAVESIVGRGNRAFAFWQVDSAPDVA
jgi:hypothetical protein